MLSPSASLRVAGGDELGSQEQGHPLGSSVFKNPSIFGAINTTPRLRLSQQGWQHTHHCAVNLPLPSWQRNLGFGVPFLPLSVSPEMGLGWMSPQGMPLT